MEVLKEADPSTSKYISEDQLVEWEAMRLGLTDSTSSAIVRLSGLDVSPASTEVKNASLEVLQEI